MTNFLPTQEPEYEPWEPAALLALRPDQDKLQAEFPGFNTWVMVSQLDTKGLYRVIRYPRGPE